MVNFVHEMPPIDIPPKQEKRVVRIELLPPCGMLTLRGDLKNATLSAALREVTGLDVPTSLECRMEGERTVFWMAPDELLLRMPQEEVADCLRELGGALQDRLHHLLVDMSDARTVFRLTGDSARETLAKGAPIDLDRDKFRPGMLRRTRIGQVAAALCQRSEKPDVFEIFCFVPMPVTFMIY